MATNYPVITKPAKAAVIQSGGGNKGTGFAPLSVHWIASAAALLRKDGNFSTVIARRHSRRGNPETRGKDNKRLDCFVERLCWIASAATLLRKDGVSLCCRNRKGKRKEQ